MKLLTMQSIENEFKFITKTTSASGKTKYANYGALINLQNDLSQ